MKHPQLKATKRTVLGKQIKKLRRQGILPANVYGKDLSSVALELPLTDFMSVYKEVGETGLIDLMVEEQKRPVLIKNMHMNFRTNLPLHVDFYQVNLKEKVKTMVPLVLLNESPAVTGNIGTLLQTLNEVEVEALPEALPENIEVSIESLAAVEDQLTVADLKAPEGVTILTDEGQVLAKIAEIVVEEEPVAEETTEEGEQATDENQETTKEESSSDDSAESSSEQKEG